MTLLIASLYLGTLAVGSFIAIARGDSVLSVLLPSDAERDPWPLRMFAGAEIICAVAYFISDAPNRGDWMTAGAGVALVYLWWGMSERLRSRK